MEELRFPNLRSPDTEVFSPNSTAVRDQNSYFSNLQNSSNDARASLQRRFTTDSSKMSTSRPFGQQYSSMNSTAVRCMPCVTLRDWVNVCSWGDNRYCGVLNVTFRDNEALRLHARI